MGKLTTHVLDTANGCPGAGMGLVLYRVVDGRRQELARTSTNSDGRCEGPLLQEPAMLSGVYEIDFSVGDYFAARGTRLDSPRFLDVVTLRFGIADPAGHYHVPLLVSPWSYSSYRGS